MKRLEPSKHSCKNKSQMSDKASYCLFFNLKYNGISFDSIKPLLAPPPPGFLECVFGLQLVEYINLKIFSSIIYFKSNSVTLLRYKEIY